MKSAISIRSGLIGRCLSAFVSIALLADAAVNLFFPEAISSEMVATGFALAQSFPLGMIMLACTVIYIIPSTSFWGAILVTGFLGGAICVHFRLGEWASPPQFVAIALGVATWAGLYLRDERVRSLFSGRDRASANSALAP
jgi:hypothetical protein